MGTTLEMAVGMAVAGGERTMPMLGREEEEELLEVETMQRLLVL